MRWEFTLPVFHCWFGSGKTLQYSFSFFSFGNTRIFVCIKVRCRFMRVCIFIHVCVSQANLSVSESSSPRVSLIARGSALLKTALLLRRLIKHCSRDGGQERQEHLSPLSSFCFALCDLSSSGDIPTFKVHWRPLYWPPLELPRFWRFGNSARFCSRSALAAPPRGRGAC